MSDEEILSVKIQDKVYEFKKEEFGDIDFYENGEVKWIDFPTVQPLDFKIGDVENKDKKVNEIGFYENGKVKNISFKEPQPIDFKIGDVENKDRKVSSIKFYENGKIQHIFFQEFQPIDFKIGDVENKDRKVSMIDFYENGKIQQIYFAEPQQIDFNIGDISYNVKIKDVLRFYIDGAISVVQLSEDFEGKFFYYGKKYDFKFYNGENITFKANGALKEECIENLLSRQIVVEKKLTKAENENKQFKESARFARKYCIWSIVFFLIAFGLFAGAVVYYPILVYRCNNVYDIYVDDVFKFLSRIIINLPAIILCYVGVKFLHLYIHYSTESRELSLLDDYLKTIPNCQGQDEAKIDIVKRLAPHFFTDKKSTKISQSFLQELMLKMIDKKQEN